MNHKFLLWYILCFCAFTATAQNDAYHNTLLTNLQADYNLTGGNWVLTPNEMTNASNATSYGHTVTQNTITGKDFSLALNLNIANTGANPWDAGYFNKNVTTVQQGDKVLMVLWIRTASTPAAQPGKISVFVEDAVTYHKEVIFTISPSNQWQQYLIPFESTDNYAINDLNIGFHLAYQQQVIEFGGLALVNYGTSVPLSNLPQVLNNENYVGSDPNAPWRTAAASRIEQHRKANMQLQVLGSGGAPLANTTVRVEMLRHKYAFGTAVTPNRLANNSNFNQVYQNKLKDLDGNGHGFNWVVTENALKWRAWEQGWAGTPAETVSGIQWLLNNNIKVRGHVLLWPGWDFMPTDMQQNSGNPTVMKSRIDGHLNAILNYQGIRENVREWDVINEIAHVRDIENALQGKTGYPTGREIYNEVFTKVVQEDPNLINYLNDYNILNNGSVVGGDYLTYKGMVQEIIDAGSKVDGIGFQAHMGTALTPPDSVYALIEDCYQAFSKTIKITEYDMSDLLSEDIAAKYTGDFLTMVFSHPATDGFLMWGFWDGAHWLGNAPLFNFNWTPKQTLTTFNDLLFNQWWTDTTLVTDANGNLDVRGFKGQYKITATVNGDDLDTQIPLNDDLNTTITLFPVSTQPVLVDSDIRVFPNPVADYLTVEMPFSDTWNISITDELGRLITTKQITGTLQFFDVRTYSAGIYLVNIQNEAGQKLTKKLVVAK